MTPATSATVRNLTSEMPPEGPVGPELEAMMHRTFAHIRPPASPPETLRLCFVSTEPSVTAGEPETVGPLFYDPTRRVGWTSRGFTKVARRLPARFRADGAGR